MASPVVNLTLLVPGIGRYAPGSAVQWSDAHALQPWQSQFCKQFAEKPWHGRHLPVAELLMGGGRDNGHGTDVSASGALMCADPVHLRVDRDTARLVPAAMLSLTEADADALLASINDFLAADDLRLSRTDVCHWFLQGQDGSALLTYPPEFLARRNASAFLPEGEQTSHWKRLMTELQMLLHSHPVNAAREQRGLMPVNSLWFWGGAPLVSSLSGPHSEECSTKAAERLREEVSDPTSAGFSASPAPRIYADEPFAVALALHLGLPCWSLDEFDPASAESDVLIVDRRLEQAMLAQDESGVNLARQRILEEWLVCWQARLQQGECLTLEIFDEDGMYGRLDAQVLSSMAQAQNEARQALASPPMRVFRHLGDRAAMLWQRLTGLRG